MKFNLFKDVCLQLICWDEIKINSIQTFHVYEIEININTDIGKTIGILVLDKATSSFKSNTLLIQQDQLRFK